MVTSILSTTAVRPRCEVGVHDVRAHRQLGSSVKNDGHALRQTVDATRRLTACKQLRQILDGGRFPISQLPRHASQAHANSRMWVVVHD